MSLPPLDLGNKSEVEMISRCMDKIGMKHRKFSEYKKLSDYEEPVIYNSSDNSSNSFEEKTVEELSTKIGLFPRTPSSSNLIMKRPAVETCGLVPKKSRTTPKTKAKITPEPKAKVAPKLRIQAVEGAATEEGSSQEPNYARQLLSPDQIIENTLRIYQG